MANMAGYTVTHINTVTTIFTPDASCFAPSNLWLQTTGCTTHHPPFSPRPTDVHLTELECPYTVLGPRKNGNRADNSCYQYNAYTAPGTVYSACPQSMTPVREETSSLDHGIILIQTTCCPEAYEFGPPSGIPGSSPTIIDGSTYSMILNTDGLCKATSVPQLQGKDLTLTLSISPEVATTVAAWGGEDGVLFATPHYLQKYLYKGGSKTSTCFGDGCPEKHNPLVPTPTPTSAPADSYIPPPSHPVTQFTPAPSCLDKSKLWLVSSDCQLVSGETLSPPWLQCTIAKAGDLNTHNTNCYQDLSKHRDRTTGADVKNTFYSACPVGYTTAHLATRHPFDEGFYDEYGPTSVYDATLSAIACCPTNYDFKYREDRVLETTTVHDGQTQTVNFYPAPECMATHVWKLANRDITMTLASEDELTRKTRKLSVRQQKAMAPTTPPPLTTTRWDVVEKTLWAAAQRISYVVFHETYTCYENCAHYFTYSYHNTDPNVTPTGIPRSVRTRPTTTARALDETIRDLNSTISGTARSVALETASGANEAKAERVGGKDEAILGDTLKGPKR